AYLGLAEARAGGAPPRGDDAPARLARALLHAERGELEAAREEAGPLLRRRASEPLLAQARRALLLRCAGDASALAAAADGAEGDEGADGADGPEGVNGAEGAAGPDRPAGAAGGAAVPLSPALALQARARAGELL